MGNELEIADDSLNRIIKKIKIIALEIKEIPKGWDSEVIIRSLMNFFPWWGVIENLIFANKDKKEIKQIIYYLHLVGNQLNKIESEKLDKNF